jgi:hypothetical protein
MIGWQQLNDEVNPLTVSPQARKSAPVSGTSKVAQVPGAVPYSFDSMRNPAIALLVP